MSSNYRDNDFHYNEMKVGLSATDSLHASSVSNNISVKSNNAIVIHKPPQSISQKSLLEKIAGPLRLSPQKIPSKKELLAIQINLLERNIPRQIVELDEEPNSGYTPLPDTREVTPEEPPKLRWETSKKSYGDQSLEKNAAFGSDPKLEMPGIQRKNGKFTEIPHLLDGFRILNQSGVEDPKDAFSVSLTKLDLEYVIEEDLSMFTNLHSLDVSENTLPLAKLGRLPTLKKLIFSCNGLKSLDLEVEGRFQQLEYLDLSFNNIDKAAQIVLATLPNLKYLDLTRNKIKSIASDIQDMTYWKDHVIEMIMPHHVAALGLENASRSKHKIESPSTLPSSLIGFQSIETLILEHNPLGSLMSLDSWLILANLPK